VTTIEEKTHQISSFQENKPYQSRQEVMKT